MPGAGADPICSEPDLAPVPRTSGARAAQKVAAPQHCSNAQEWGDCVHCTGVGLQRNVVVGVGCTECGCSKGWPCSGQCTGMWYYKG